MPKTSKSNAAHSGANKPRSFFDLDFSQIRNLFVRFRIEPTGSPRGVIFERLRKIRNDGGLLTAILLQIIMVIGIKIT